MKDDRFYLLHILDCIQRIEADTAGGIDSFRASRTIQDAVIRNLQILAESSQRLSAQLKSRSSQVEWNRIAAMSPTVSAMKKAAPTSRPKEKEG